MPSPDHRYSQLKKTILTWSVHLAKLDESGQMNNCTSDLALHEIMKVVEADTDYQLNYKALVQHKQLKSLPWDHPAQKLSSIWDALLVKDELPNLMLYHGRIYIPQGAVELVMKKLHIQHTAFDKTLRYARSMNFWMGMKKDIRLIVSSCDWCLENSPLQRKEPLVQTVASRPMEQTSIDLAQYGGKTYLVLADRYSGWILVEKYAKSPDQMAVCNTLNNWF